MSDELQNHMNKGMYGTPLTNDANTLELFAKESMSSSRLKNCTTRKVCLICHKKCRFIRTSVWLSTVRSMQLPFPNWSSLQMIMELISLQRPIAVFRMLQPILRLFFATRLKPFTKKKLIFLSATLRKRRIRLSLSIVLSSKDFSAKKETGRKKPRFPLELNIMPDIVQLATDFVRLFSILNTWKQAFLLISIVAWELSYMLKTRMIATNCKSSVFFSLRHNSSKPLFYRIITIFFAIFWFPIKSTFSCIESFGVAWAFKKINASGWSASYLW